MNYCQITFAKPAWDNDEAMIFTLFDKIWICLCLLQNNLREIRHEVGTLHWYNT